MSQGSVLGPLQFISYTDDVTSAFVKHEVNISIADDKDVDIARRRLHGCVSSVSSWCASRRLQLNEEKTELAWFGKRSCLNKLDAVDCTLTIDTDSI